MFHRHKLFKQKADVGTLLTNNEIQFLGFLFSCLLPTISLSLILCISPIVRANVPGSHKTHLK